MSSPVGLTTTTGCCCGCGGACWVLGLLLVLLLLGNSLGANVADKTVVVIGWLLLVVLAFVFVIDEAAKLELALYLKETFKSSL